MLHSLKPRAVSRSLKQSIAREVRFVVLAAVTFLMAFPLLIIIFTAVKSDPEMVLQQFRLLPREWRFDNFSAAFQYGDWGRYYFNSLYITVVTVVGSLLLNSLAGFSFARLRFPGREAIFFLFLVGMMVPYQSIVIPQFVVLRSIPLAGGNDLLGQGGRGWLNTYWALIVPFLSGSFGIFLCRQFFFSIPKSLDEAARIDGARPFYIYWRIFLPLAKPVLATLAILKTAHTWNNFFYPLVMISSRDMYTVQLALQQFQGQFTVQWNLLMAATLVSILPMVAVFLLAQKHFVAGIVTSGIKG
ncbi:MAG: carbohydrate ABC transporter permease [Spirochaetaceae bacterium]|nr:MAG: carbohydrate ABC transporter permease [Spirochaetaceae bacterium]